MELSEKLRAGCIKKYVNAKLQMINTMNNNAPHYYLMRRELWIVLLAG